MRKMAKFQLMGYCNSQKQIKLNTWLLTVLKMWAISLVILSTGEDVWRPKSPHGRPERPNTKSRKTVQPHLDW